MTEAQYPMDGKVCLVTGATRGLGYAAALGLAGMGARVVILSRDPLRVERAVEQLRMQNRSADVDGWAADLSSQADVRRAAETFLERYSRLDVLINNVGSTLLKYQTSPDGIEMTWALNYLNHFLLSYLLLGALKSTATVYGEARVIEITSSMYRYSSPDFSRIQKEAGYNGVMAYAQSKRAVIMYACELAKRLQGTGVTINAITPGAVRTHIAGGNGWLAALLMRMVGLTAVSEQQGVQPILHLAAAPELRGVSGKYYKKYRKMPEDPSCCDPDCAHHLWLLSEAMSGLH